MKRNILVFINKLQTYKTAIKNLHWSSKNMSEHKLWDEIADTVANIQDEVAEIAQGIFGQIKPNELKPRRYNITNSKKTISDMLKDTKLFYATIKRGENNIGIRSTVENFIGELEKYQYLMDLSLKEDIKRNIKETLNENNFKSPYKKMMAAKHAAGKSTEQAKKEMKDFFTQRQAIADINKSIADDNRKNPHNKKFNNAIDYSIFDTDFNVLDDFEPIQYVDADNKMNLDPNPNNGFYYNKWHTYQKYNESKQPNNTKIKLTEQELRNLIKEAINNVLCDDFKQDEIDASWDAYKNTRQPISKYGVKGNLETYLDDEHDWYDMGIDAHDEVMDSEGNYEDKMDDFLDDYHQFAKNDEGFNGMQAQKEEPHYKRYYQDRFAKPERKLDVYR